jgi:predicted dehydrogenase
MVLAKIPVLVVGTGFGCRAQVPALRAAGFDVVGLVGTDGARTRERAQANGVANAFTDLDQAISRTGAAAVAVSTPPHSHAPLTLAAIARGCHVLCEKPFAKDVAEARSMLQAAESAGVVHLIGHEFRFAPERAMMARVIADGAIGEPKLANFTSFIPFLMVPDLDMPPWWFNEEAGGGWLGAASSHLIDWIRCTVGDFDSLSGALATLAPQHGATDDTFAFRFRLSGGLEGVVQQSAAAWGPPLDLARVMGTKGTVWLEGREIKVADREGSRVIPIAEDLRLPPMPALSDDPRNATEKWKFLTPIELPPYVRLCEGWRALIEGREPACTVPLPTFRDGIAAMEAIDAVRLSAANGGALVKVNGG